jgi:hypothetical protein
MKAARTISARHGGVNWKMGNRRGVNGGAVRQVDAGNFSRR